MPGNDAGEELALAAQEIVRKHCGRPESTYPRFHLIPAGDVLQARLVYENKVHNVNLPIPGWQDKFAGAPDRLADYLLGNVMPKLRLVERATITDRNYLFLRVLDDLERRCGSSDEFDLLGIAGLLRLLLCDDYPLVNQVNRETRHRIRFRVGETFQTQEPEHQQPPHTPGGPRLVRIKKGLEFFAFQDALLPQDGRQIREVKLKELLSLQVIEVNEHRFTVLELIQHVAYIGGLLHAGEPKKTKDRALLSFRELFRVEGAEPALETLRAIGVVVLGGLAPVRKGIVRKRSGDDSR